MILRCELTDGTLFTVKGVRAIGTEEGLLIIKTKELECCIFLKFIKEYKLGEKEWVNE